jgi:hypothetical protein
MLEGEVAEIGPQRVRRDVGDDDGIACRGGRAARTHAKSDSDPVDGGVVLGRQAGRRTFDQVSAVFGQHQDRAEHLAVRRLLHHQDDVAHDIAQGAARGDAS